MADTRTAPPPHRRPSGRRPGLRVTLLSVAAAILLLGATRRAPTATSSSLTRDKRIFLTAGYAKAGRGPLIGGISGGPVQAPVLVPH